MASLTINDLKNELINHGIELPPSSAKKEDYVQLYEENISVKEKATIDFSSDDDELSLPVGGKISKKKVSRKSEGMNGINHKADCNGEEVKNGELTEENSLVVGDIDVSTLTDEQLAEKLKEFNITVGPIVESTRTVYQKKLAISMRESMKTVTTVDDTVSDVENNNLSETFNDKVDAENEELKDAEFSADDDEDPYQPSCVNLSTSNCSKSTISNDSPLSLRKPSEEFANFTNIRQRFNGSNKEANVVDGRYTPTPRRSIHSYKVTETSKETVTKAKDGTISRDYDYKKTTSTSEAEIGPVRRFVRFLPTIFMLLIIAAVGYYIYVSRK